MSSLLSLLPSVRSRQSPAVATLGRCVLAVAVQATVFFTTPLLNVVYDGWPRGWLVHLVAVLAAFVAGLWPGLAAEATGVTAIWWSARYFTPMHPGLEVFAAIGVLQILIINQLQRTHRALLQRQSDLEAARHHAEEARAVAQNANRTKDEFLATLSHELRTPLTVILGYCAMGETGRIGPDDRQRVMKIIERNALAQLRMVEDLFEVQRLVRGGDRLHYEAVDLKAATAAVIEILRPAADDKHVVIDLALEPVTIAGDRDRIRQILSNLLSNAIKFSPENDCVELAITRNAGQAVVRVENRGDPIPPAFLAHLFEPFRQADMSTTRAHGGLGLGLAIVKGVIDLHAGSIEVDSNDERTVFTVRLPIERPGDGASQARMLATSLPS